MTEQEKALFSLGLSPEEVAEVLADDAKIDKGEKLFELTEDQQKASKKARAAGRVPGVYKFDKRERKTDEDKRHLMRVLEDAVCGLSETLVEVVNPERELVFVYNGKKYKITLSAPRK